MSGSSAAMPVPRRRHSRASWVVMCGLIASLSINWVLPALDHHVAEYSPFHSHLRLGAGPRLEAGAPVAAHTHGAGQPHTHEAAPGEAASAPIVSTSTTVIGTAGASGWLTLGASLDQALAAADWALPQPLLALWLTLIPAALFLRQPHTPLPEQPPRAPR